MKKLIALRPLANRIEPGDVFDASDAEAVVHLAIGSAREAEADPAPDPEPTAADLPPTRRTYRRRDLNAEP